MNGKKLVWLLMGFVAGSGFGILAGNYLSHVKSSTTYKKTAVAKDQKDTELEKAAKNFLMHYIAHADSINYLLFSKYMIERYKSLGAFDPISYANLVNIEPRPDSAEILGIVTLAPESARVFVGMDWFRQTDAFYIKALGFVKELNGWKFNGFDYEYETEGAENTPSGLLK